MTPGQDPAPPPDHARAETYLRLRAEAELRRVEALPRPDPLAVIGVPAPLRGPVRLALPFGQRAVTAVQPLAENAARTLQPLAENAARTLQPLAENAARTLQPLAGAAAWTLQPVTRRLAGTVLPAAEQAARRLNPLVWRAASRVQGALPLSRPHRSVIGRPATPAEPSAQDGLRRLGAVAQALAHVGAIDHGTADAVIAGLETALAARSRIRPHPLWVWARHRRRQQGSTRPPTGTYVAAAVGVPAAIPPESGLRNVQLVTVVIAPDRAILVLAGQLADADGGPSHRDPWPTFGRPSGSHPAATDDRGNSYVLREDSGWSDEGGAWDSTMRFSPVPPAGTRWLELTMSPGTAPIRVDLAAAGGSTASGPQPAAGSPAGRLIDAAATRLLYAAIGDGEDDVPRYDLSQVADVVTALDAVGVLEPARDDVGRLVTLAGRLGVDVPPVLRAASPARAMPAAWVSVLENRRRRDGPRGVAPAAAVLPDLDGARFLLAGMRSQPDRAKLVTTAWGNLRMRSFLEYGGNSPWSWWARDDQGRWHVMFQESYSVDDGHAELRLVIKPPLHPRATSLEVTLTGPSGQVTTTVALDWGQP